MIAQATTHNAFGPRQKVPGERTGCSTDRTIEGIGRSRPAGATCTATAQQTATVRKGNRFLRRRAKIALEVDSRLALASILNPIFEGLQRGN